MGVENGTFSFFLSELYFVSRSFVSQPFDSMRFPVAKNLPI